MKTLISALVLLTVGQALQRPAAPPAPTSRSMVLLQQLGQQQIPMIVAGRGAGTQGIKEQACETVLVVPTPDLTVENLTQIAEDMTVMCRILDKTVAPSLTTWRAVRPMVRAENLVGVLIGDDESQTQGLYLGGYGALFFVQVDFSLRPPPAQPGQTPPAEGPTADAVWSQTVEELQGSPPASPGTAPPAQPYDALKVENLKAALLKSLRHAANLRLASPRDSITLVVGPRDSSARMPYALPGTGRSAWQVTPKAAGPQAESASALILRTDKATADAFAKGQWTLDQFTEKTQILWWGANLSPSEPPTPIRATGLQTK